MKEYILNGKVMLAASVPYNGTAFSLFVSEMTTSLQFILNRKPHFIALPPGEYKILGKPKEVTEEQWRELVDRDYLEVVNIGEYDGFVCYYDDRLYCDTATESGLSFCKVEGIDDNSVLIEKIK